MIYFDKDTFFGGSFHQDEMCKHITQKKPSFLKEAGELQQKKHMWAPSPLRPSNTRWVPTIAINWAIISINGQYNWVGPGGFFTPISGVISPLYLQNWCIRNSHLVHLIGFFSDMFVFPLLNHHHWGRGHPRGHDLGGLAVNPEPRHNGPVH